MLRSSPSGLEVPGNQLHAPSPEPGPPGNALQSRGS